jgi:hypothetical protein
MIKEENATNKDRYKSFCSEESDIPIFSKPWYLDAVAGEKMWNVCLIEKGGEIVASMPYIVKKKFGFKISTMPKFSHTLGPYIKYPKGQKYYKKLSWEKKIMTEIINQLPKVDYFSQNFNSNVLNWLPFYWKGYEQTTRYTYILENIPLEVLEERVENDVRRRRRRAKDLGVEVVESNDIEKFYELYQKSLNKKNIKILAKQLKYNLKIVKNLYHCCKVNGSVRMLFAELNGKPIAANFLVYDSNTVFYIMGWTDRDKKDLGGMDAVQFEAIKFAMQSGREFDFEGSMTESIEKYFRSFGAVQKQFFNITKYNSKILKLRNAII